MRRFLCRQPFGSRHREQGVAMLEFVLMLPFIWIILILIFNFGQIFLARHRALVVAREMGIRQSQTSAGTSGVPISSVATALAGDTLGPRGIRAQFTQRTDGTCPGPVTERPNESARDSAVSELHSDRIASRLAGFLGRVSSSHAYDVAATLPPLVGGLLTDRTFSACLVIDGSPWTFAETGGPTDWLGALLPF